MRTKYANSGSVTVSSQGLAGNVSVNKMEPPKATELDQIVSEMSMTVSAIKLCVGQLQDKLNKLSYLGEELGEESKGVSSPEPQTITDRFRQLSSSQSVILQELEVLVGFANRTI